MNNILQFIEKLKINNKCVVAAISGGPDSMLLIDILLSLREKLNLKIVVAHVHHNYRKASDDEKIKVEEYCKKNNLIFEFKKIEKYPNNKFSEENARKLRYEFFDQIIKKYNSDILFTAHHGDDLVETVLMRLSRGSTLKGYSGFSIISKDRGYIIARPLIYLTKEKILSLVEEKGLWYANDMSNADEKYTRNRYRKKILPELKKENKNIHLKFIDYNEKLLLASEYISSVANKFQIADNIINIAEFNKLAKIIKIFVLEKYLKDIYNESINEVTSVHINIIIKNLENYKNIVFDLPCNKKGIIEYNNFAIEEKNTARDYEYRFTEKIVLPDNSIIEIDNDTKLTNNFVIHLNSNDVKLPFYVRNRRKNDKMIIKNMAGHRKVNDIFTDVKLSKRLRESYPIVLDATGTIIWIPGIKKSNFDRKKEGKYDIILKYIKGGDYE